MGGLSDSQWKNSAPNDVKGMKPYIVIRHKMAAKGKWEISVREDVEDAVMQVAILEGVTGKTNPLSSVRNVELKLDGTKIVAINLDDDCVVRK
jgi:hypothetical protein